MTRRTRLQLIAAGLVPARMQADTDRRGAAADTARLALIARRASNRNRNARRLASNRAQVIRNTPSRPRMIRNAVASSRRNNNKEILQFILDKAEKLPPLSINLLTQNPITYNYPTNSEVVVLPRGNKHVNYYNKLTFLSLKMKNKNGFFTNPMTRKPITHVFIQKINKNKITPLSKVNTANWNNKDWNRYYSRNEWHPL